MYNDCMNKWWQKVKSFVFEAEKVDDYIEDDTFENYSETDGFFDNEVEADFNEKTAQENENEILQDFSVELPVDVYQKDNEIVVQAFVPASTPSMLDITIARDMLTIEGSREPQDMPENDDYFTRELNWGTFSRTILLPEEIDVESSSANENHGLLTIRMPKINKAKKAKLKVKAGR